MDKEVVGIDRFKYISECLEFVTVCYAGFPGIHRDAIHLEEDVLSVRTNSVSPVIIRIDLRIESDLRQDEPCHRSCDSSVVTALQIASLRCKMWYDFHELVIYEVHNRAALRLSHFINRKTCLGHERNSTEHIHYIEVEEGTYGTHFGCPLSDLVLCRKM